MRGIPRDEPNRGAPGSSNSLLVLLVQPLCGAVDWKTFTSQMELLAPHVEPGSSETFCLNDGKRSIATLKVLQAGCEILKTSLDALGPHISAEGKTRFLKAVGEQFCKKLTQQNIPNVYFWIKRMKLMNPSTNGDCFDFDKYMPQEFRANLARGDVAVTTSSDNAAATPPPATAKTGLGEIPDDVTVPPTGPLVQKIQSQLSLTLSSGDTKGVVTEEKGATKKLIKSVLKRCQLSKNEKSSKSIRKKLKEIFKSFDKPQLKLNQSNQSQDAERYKKAMKDFLQDLGIVHQLLKKMKRIKGGKSHKSKKRGGGGKKRGDGGKKRGSSHSSDRKRILKKLERPGKALYEFNKILQDLRGLSDITGRFWSLYMESVHDVLSDNSEFSKGVTNDLIKLELSEFAQKAFEKSANPQFNDILSSEFEKIKAPPGNSLASNRTLYVMFAEMTVQAFINKKGWNRDGKYDVSDFLNFIKSREFEDRMKSIDSSGRVTELDTIDLQKKLAGMTGSSVSDTEVNERMHTKDREIPVWNICNGEMKLSKVKLGDIPASKFNNDLKFFCNFNSPSEGLEHSAPSGDSGDSASGTGSG